MSTTIALVLYPGLTPLDLIGPLQVVSTLARLRPEFRPIVVAERPGEVIGDDGLTFVTDAAFVDAPHPNVLVVPGGGKPTLEAMSHEPLRAYVRQAAGTADLVTTVCTGALIVAATGLLNGRDATTHWAYRGILEHYGARYRRRRWVEDGPFLMSAGVSAGIDTALRLVARLTDDTTARAVQRAMDYDPRPPFGGLDYDRMPLLARAMGTMHALLAPRITRRARRLIAEGR